MAVTQDVLKNLQKARQFIKQAATNSVDLVILPECFNSPYGTKYFPQYAESIPDGQSCQALSSIAKESSVYLVGGSIPEKQDGKFYNTSTVYNPQGQLIVKHRKVHLFDIDIPGKIRFKESEILSPGNQVTMFSMNVGQRQIKVGLGICYDMRFPELAQICARKGCELMIYPGAFNLTTGPMHWELLLRSRACDNQMFTIGCSPARVIPENPEDYVAYGHSMVVNPYGKVLTQLQEDEQVLYADLDLNELSQVQTSIPINTQRRFDIYPDVSATFN